MSRYAIATDGNNVSEHFGRCQAFTLVDLVQDRIEQINRLTNPSHQPDYLPRFLKKRGVKAVVTGGIGPRAQSLLQKQNIQVFNGVQGTIDQVYEQILTGNLSGRKNTCRPGEGRSHETNEGFCHHHHDRSSGREET